MTNKEYLPYDSQKAVAYYAAVYTGFWKEFPEDLVKDYVETVKQVSNSHGLVLCVGSGLGNEAEILQGYGLTAVCLDGAKEMVNASMTKGLVSIQGNFLNLPFLENKFDGVLAYKSLNHSQDMEQLRKSLTEIRRVLKHGGAFSICMLRGRVDERKSSFFDGSSTRENLYLTEGTFLQLLENHNFAVETFANIRRGHTDYMIANTVNFNK